MEDAHMANGDLLFDEIQINLDMLCALMLNRVCGEVDNIEIVIVHQGAATYSLRPPI